MYVLYILYSEKLDRFYVGYTNDIERRIAEHNRIKRKYTSFDVTLAGVVDHLDAIAFDDDQRRVLLDGAQVGVGVEVVGNVFAGERRRSGGDSHKR